MSSCAKSTSSGITKSSRHHLWLVVVSVAIIHIVCYKASAPLRLSHGYDSAASFLTKRDFSPNDAPVEVASSLIDYRRIYDSASSSARPAVFVAMALWLIFLFAFVGITAADFFCPNLSTIASRLGMSESVAGVTFLAFSNGSPDVFSTFAALRSNSGALAIGELLGAASFIVSVVAGTMCVIQPFRVARHSFLRDVGFFTIAVTFTLGILYDSHIHAWEAAAMVSLYLIYVLVVAVGSWWVSRKEARDTRIRQAREEYAEESEDYLSHGSSSRALSTRSARTPATTTPQDGHAFPSIPSPSNNPHLHRHHSLDQETFDSLTERGSPVTITRTRGGKVTSTHAPTHRRPKTRSTHRPSLLGAIEFRDVVNSLREDSSARTLAVFGGRGVGEEHSHASYVGDEAGGDRASSSRRARSASCSEPAHLDGVVETGIQRPPLRARSPSWAPGLNEESRRWTESDAAEARADGEDTLVDLSSGVDNPWHIPADSRKLRLDLSNLPASTASTRTLRTLGGGDAMTRTNSAGSIESRKPIRRVPSILLTTASGAQTTVLAARVPKWHHFRHRKSYRISRAVFLALFPSLQDFRSKSWIGKATALLCVPAILLLNLTLPVVDSEEHECDDIEEKRPYYSSDGYRDGGEEDESEAGSPTEGVLVDTRDLNADVAEDFFSHRKTLSDSPPTLTDSEARRQREAVGRQFHSRAVPHPEASEYSDDTPPASQATSPLPHAETSTSPWGVSGEDPAHDVQHFRMASSDDTVNRIPISRSGSMAESAVIEGEDEEKDPTNSVLTRWLTAVQCTLAPVFCATALLSDDLQWWYPLVALAAGLVLASIAFWVFEDHRHPGRIVLCFVGFFVAMVWILMIVNEVVGILQTFGHIFGLSDAILGLTVFAMGNSLGDLVANATVARMGYPSMAIAACFGGPMLNILLGVGLSGSYIIFRNGGEPYHVAVGRTLLVSGAGLLLILITTLIVIPLNGYWMDKKIGVALMTGYGIVLSATVAMEIWG